MSRGTPKAGYRNTKALAQKLAKIVVPEPHKDETDDQVKDRINKTFEMMEIIVDDCISADDGYSTIITGPAGIGKSYTVEHKLLEDDPEGDCHRINKGYLRATGLYKLLYDYRQPGNVLVFDDADHILRDETSLNILKAACDTGERRVISWGTEAVLISEREGGEVPHNFLYEGNIVIITNLNLDELSQGHAKLSPHYKALIDRSQYIDLDMWAARDRMLRVKSLIEDQGMLDYLAEDKRKEVIQFMEEQKELLRDISCRTAVKLAKLCHRDNWRDVAAVTMCRKGLPAVRLPEAVVAKLPPEYQVKVLATKPTRKPRRKVG